MTQFIVHLGRAGDGLRYLLPEKLMVTPAHPLRRFLQRFLRHTAVARGFGVSLFSASFDEVRFQAIEKFGLARRGEFLCEPRQDLVEQGHGPATLEKFVRAALVRWFEPITLFRLLHLERMNLAPADPLLRAGPVRMVR